MNGQELASQFTSAALVVYVLRHLKQQPWFAKLVAAAPLDDATIHRLLSGLGAVMTAIGIHAAFGGSADTGWHVAITIPPLAVLIHGTWDWLQQVIMQQVLYEAMGDHTAGPPPPVKQP